MSEVKWWAMALVAMFGPVAISAVPFVLMVKMHAGANIEFLGLLLFILGGVGGGIAGLNFHHRWHMATAQKRFEDEQTRKMAQTMTVDQLVTEAMAGRFPYKCDKPWGR